MKLKRSIVLGTIASLAVSCGVPFFFLHRVSLKHNTEKSSLEIVADTHTHKAYSFDTSLYALVATSTFTQKYTEKVFGGITSHHLLASIDISAFFAEFRDQDVERVIIVGPNHFYSSEGGVVTTTHSYQTPFGLVKTDGAFAQELIDARLGKESVNTMNTEHAVSSLVPYIAAYLPQAKIVPLALKRESDISAYTKLVDFLVEHTNDKTIIIASVDFSHHLDVASAYMHDARSLSAIDSFDYASLSELEVDSPQSLYVVMKVLERKGVQMFKSWQQNAAQIFNDENMEDVTSYVFTHALPGEKRSHGATSILFAGEGSKGSSTKDTLKGIRGMEGNFLRGYDKVLYDTDLHLPQNNTHDVVEGTGNEIVLSVLEENDTGVLQEIQNKKNRKAVVYLQDSFCVTSDCEKYAKVCIDAGASVVLFEGGTRSVYTYEAGVIIVEPKDKEVDRMGIGLLSTDGGMEVYIFPYTNVGGFQFQMNPKERAYVCKNIVANEVVSKNNCVLTVKDAI